MIIFSVCNSFLNNMNKGWDLDLQHVPLHVCMSMKFEDNALFPGVVVITE